MTLGLLVILHLLLIFIHAGDSFEQRLQRVNSCTGSEGYKEGHTCTVFTGQRAANTNPPPALGDACLL